MESNTFGNVVTQYMMQKNHMMFFLLCFLFFLCDMKMSIGLFVYINILIHYHLCEIYNNFLFANQ